MAMPVPRLERMTFIVSILSADGDGCGSDGRYRQTRDKHDLPLSPTVSSLMMMGSARRRGLTTFERFLIAPTDCFGVHDQSPSPPGQASSTRALRAAIGI